MNNVGTNSIAVLLQVDDASTLVINEPIVGLTSATSGTIVSIDTNIVRVIYPDGLFEVGETVSILGGANTAVVVAFTEIFNE